MARVLFGMLLLGHGLIHIIGFLGEWNLGLPAFLRENRLIPLSDTSAKTAGIMWLISAFLWLGITLLYFQGKDDFWKVALVTVIISQLLIIVYWPYARFGTIMNILVLGVVIAGIARTTFERNVNREWVRLAAAGSTKVITLNDADLPPIVKKWLLATKSKKQVPSRVTLTQQGAMRSKASAAWMSFNAQQYYTVNPPGFIWSSQIKAAPMITIAGRDKFEKGKGNMIIKPLYIHTLANTSGPEIDQGTMLRYMGELIWFPEAAAMQYFTWEQIDSTSAELTMTYNGISAKGVFTFDVSGLVRSFSAERFGDFNGQFRKETWEVRIVEHSLINDHLIGSKCEVTWKLKEGDFTWLKLEVKDITYQFN